MTIADAPWIREAENDGMPPYEEDEFPTSDVAEEFSKAGYFIEKAVFHLESAAEFVEDFIRCREAFDELIMRLQDFQIDLKDEQKKVEGGAYE